MAVPPVRVEFLLSDVNLARTALWVADHYSAVNLLPLAPSRCSKKLSREQIIGPLAHSSTPSFTML